MDWRDLYSRKDAFAWIYQYRRDVVWKIVDSLSLPARERMLEVGCGPGLTAIELARRGYSVDALDVAPAMIELTRRLASESGVSVRTLLGDVCGLPFPDATFRLVLAVGVNPIFDWLKKFMRRSDPKSRPTIYSRRQFNAALEKSGLRLSSGVTFGFGPFSLFNWRLFPDHFAIRVHEWLQRAADRDTPFLRGAGHVYVALARK